MTEGEWVPGTRDMDSLVVGGAEVGMVQGMVNDGEIHDIRVAVFATLIDMAGKEYRFVFTQTEHAEGFATSLLEAVERVRAMEG